MKTIIIYSTKYGYTKDCVDALKSQLSGDVLAVDLGTDTVSSLEAFDRVVLGGSIYMGQVNKKLKAFCESRLAKLLEKPVALFLCCGLPENFEQNLAAAFPGELIEKAIAAECFGGELRMEKMKGPDRIISGLMKKASKGQGKTEVETFPANITKLAAAIGN